MSQLNSATDDDYVNLAWALRSNPRFLREQVFRDWVFDTLCPPAKPSDPEACITELETACKTLQETFNERDARWQRLFPPHFTQAVTR